MFGQPAGLLYRLVTHDHPDQADIRVSGTDTSAEDLARDIYQVDPPDFIQVRTVRGALDDPSQRVHVDQSGRYLDDFRNYRDQAAAGEPTDDGLQSWTFPDDNTSEPFVRVEDAIGDGTDPSAFPTQLRVAFYRDGTVRTYAISQPGDSLEDLEQPDTSRWQAILPSVKGWQTGVVEGVPPFTAAVNDAGVLLPDRLLVIRFSPAIEPASAPITAGLSCAGLPLALVLGGSGLVAGRRARCRALGALAAGLVLSGDAVSPGGAVGSPSRPAAASATQAPLIAPSAASAAAMRELGRHGVGLMLRALDDPSAPPEHVRLKAELVVRRTTGGISNLPER